MTWIRQTGHDSATIRQSLFDRQHYPKQNLGFQKDPPFGSRKTMKNRKKRSDAQKAWRDETLRTAFGWGEEPSEEDREYQLITRREDPESGDSDDGGGGQLELM